LISGRPTLSAEGAAGLARPDRIEQLEQEINSLRQAIADLTQQFDTFRKQFD
jgi:hypothetical protein